MRKNKKILKNMSYVSLGTIFSRILGYFRDMLVANVFGAGFFADAFYAAFRIPNLFRRLFGESSLNAAFVPVLSEYLNTKTKQETEELISAVATVIFVCLSVLTILGVIFSFPITRVITWGFSKEKLLLASRLLQIMFPYMLLICLSALGLSILNCLKIFFIPAASSASLSVSEIIFVLFFVRYLSSKTQIEGLAVSVVVGGLLQVVINYFVIRKQSYSFKINVKKFFEFLKSEPIQKIGILFVPVVVGFSVDQINALVDTFCASFLREGSVTALYYSNRLMQFPLALFGTSLVTVTLPQMADEFIGGLQEEMNQTVLHSVRNVIFFLLPASVGLIVLGRPIIITLFEHGNFTRQATLMTDSCLMFYSSGLIFFSISKIFVSSFYAMKKNFIPVRIASLCVVINFILNIVLMKPLKVGGLALATTITSFISCILLYHKLKKYTNIKLFTSSTIKFLLNIAIINLYLVFILILVRRYVQNNLIITGVGICSGVVVYFILTYLFKIEETGILVVFVKKIFTFQKNG